MLYNVLKTSVKEIMERKAYYGTEDLENLTKTYDLTDVEEETDAQIVEVDSEDFADNSNFDASKFRTDDLDEILEYWLCNGISM